MEGVFEFVFDCFFVFNYELYYKDYVVTNLVEFFEEVGLRYEVIVTAWVLKIMVFFKLFDG